MANKCKDLFHLLDERTFPNLAGERESKGLLTNPCLIEMLYDC